MTDAASTDHELVLATAAGDAPAFELLLARHRASLVRWATRSAGDAALAEDAVQEALTAAWRSAAAFRGDGSVRGWLCTMVRHALGRQLARRRHVDSEDPATLEVLGARAGWGDPTLGARVESVVASRECLEHAFSRLAGGDREILALVDIEGASLDEATEALDLTLAAVKSRLHRARLKLVAALSEEDCDGR